MRPPILVAITLLATACSSAPASEPNDEGSGGSGEPAVETGSCGCDADEICAGGRCLAETTLGLSVLQGGPAGLASLSAMHWTSVSTEPLPSTIDGACGISAGLPVSNAPIALDVGTAQLQIGDAPPVAFSAFVDGEAKAGTDGNIALTPGGGDTITLSWTGGADLPAGDMTYAMPTAITFTAIDPFVAGQPWTVTWEETSTVQLLFFTPEEEQVFCLVQDGTSLTLPGSITALLEEAPGGLVAGPSRLEQPTPEGITVYGAGHIIAPLELPEAP